MISSIIHSNNPVDERGQVIMLRPVHLNDSAVVPISFYVITSYVLVKVFHQVQRLCGENGSRSADLGMVRLTSFPSEPYIKKPMNSWMCSTGAKEHVPVCWNVRSGFKKATNCDDLFTCGDKEHCRSMVSWTADERMARRDLVIESLSESLSQQTWMLSCNVCRNIC